MAQSTIQWCATAFVLATVLTVSGCHKKTALSPPAPPSPPAAPTAAISMSPSCIQAGQAASLTWQTSDATDVSIDGIGAVEPNGSQSVSPTESTTYYLTAKGAGGTQDATSRLTITQPAPPPMASIPNVTDQNLFSRQIKDVYFDYDKSDIRSDQQTSIQADVAFLTAHTDITLTVEGHCDERGSDEYNVALGDERASAVTNALKAAGVSASRINTVSYGKEKPFCTESNEACWQENRRGHFVDMK